MLPMVCRVGWGLVPLERTSLYECGLVVWEWLSLFVEEEGSCIVPCEGVVVFGSCFLGCVWVGHYWWGR